MKFKQIRNSKNLTYKVKNEENKDNVLPNVSSNTAIMWVP